MKVLLEVHGNIIFNKEKSGIKTLSVNKAGNLVAVASTESELVLYNLEFERIEK